MDKWIQHTISFKNNRIYSILNKQNSGFGVRVNIDDKTGFSYSNDTKKLEETINNAIELSPYGETEKFKLPANSTEKFKSDDHGSELFNTESEIEKGKNAIDTLLKDFPDANIDIGISKSIGTMRLLNSKNFDQSYSSAHYSASISATQILKDGSKVDIWESKSVKDVEEFNDIILRLKEKMTNALNTTKLESGKIPIILTPKALGRVIGIVLTGLNGRSVYKNISPFKDKIGKSIFHKNLTITDDPTLTSSPFSFPFDDEGVKAQKKTVIQNGAIKAFITDLKNAERLNMEATGNGSRGFSSLPSPSFSNVIIQEGNESYKEMIKGLKKGILIDQFIGLGQSNTLTGDFSAALDLAYLVENGEIVGRVKDCMISDNLFNLFKEEIIMSKEVISSGSITAPYILLPSVNYTS